MLRIKNAFQDWMYTKAGFNRMMFHENMPNGIEIDPGFLWADIEAIPPAILSKHSLIKMNEPQPENIIHLTYDANKHAFTADELCFHVYNIRWDTDGISIRACNLPRKTNIPVKHLLEQNGNNRFNIDTCLDLITEYLSDTYGFCIYGYNI